MGPDGERVWSHGAADVVMAGALDDEPDIVLFRYVEGVSVPAPRLQNRGCWPSLTKLDAQLDMEGFRGVYNEDRISLTAARSTFVWKAGVVGPLVPVNRDGVGLVELKG